MEASCRPYEHYKSTLTQFFVCLFVFCELYYRKTVVKIQHGHVCLSTVISRVTGSRSCVFGKFITVNVYLFIFTLDSVVLLKKQVLYRALHILKAS